MHDRPFLLIPVRSVVISLFIPDAAKFVFVCQTSPFITFVDCFKETAISFIDSSIFLFSVSLISRLYLLPFSCFEVLFLCYAVPMIQATNIFSSSVLR